MHQDSFRSVVCRSLSKSLPPRSKDGSYPETVQCVVPCVVTLQPSVFQGCQGQEPCWSQSYREERSMSLQRDHLMAPSLSKHFAEDLLRGAMDLQESLAMLERFRAASQSMRRSNKKKRPETGEKSPDIDTIIREVLLRPSNAKKVLPRTVSNGLRRQSSNSTDDLKNLVKDSLHKKNLWSVSSNNEQPSLSESTRYSTNNCLVSKTKQKKVVPRSFPSCAPVQTNKSAPSLVAKLMGLDGLPSQNDHSIMKDEKIKPVSSPRALFDIEMPKSKSLLPQLSGEDSQFNTEMHASEKLPPEHCNAGMNYNRSLKIIGPSYDTPVINEIGSMKPIHREKNMEQVRAKSPKEIKVVSPTSRKQQTEEPTEINRRTREKQKSHFIERNREGRKDVKAKASSASRAKILQKTDKKLAASSSSSSGSMKPILRKAPSNSRQKTTTRRNVKSSTVDEIVAYQVQREIDRVLDESDGPSTEHSATPSDESVGGADWDAESSVDDIRNDLSESNESFISTSHGESINSADADHQTSAIIPTKEAEMKDEISLLLLSDESFLSRAAATTGIGSYDHLTNRYKGTTKPERKNRELYLDTAAELLERKHGLQNSLCYTGFQGEKRRSTTYFSLEALLTDISNGIRKLNSYAATDALGTTDSLHMKLERDLRCKDTWINGMWDMDWENWVFMEETECFVRDAGEDILSLLMEEAALDLSDIL